MKNTDSCKTKFLRKIDSGDALVGFVSDFCFGTCSSQDQAAQSRGLLGFGPFWEAGCGRAKGVNVMRSEA